MENEKDLFNIKKNFIALALFLVIILLLIDIVLRLAPGMLKPDFDNPRISAVGHHHQFKDGASYYIYTVFESTGDVYQCWWDEKRWNQKKVTNYRWPTLPETQPDNQ
jgi:hypothetical protein